MILVVGTESGCSSFSPATLWLLPVSSLGAQPRASAPSRQVHSPVLFPRVERPVLLLAAL